VDDPTPTPVDSGMTVVKGLHCLLFGQGRSTTGLKLLLRDAHSESDSAYCLESIATGFVCSLCWMLKAAQRL